MFDIWFWVWVISAAILLVAEIFTAGFFMLPFGIAAACAAVMNFLDVELVWQLVGFLAISIVLFVSSRRLAERITHEPPVQTGANRLVGKQGLVIEKLVPHTSMGQVRIEREEWRADSTCEEPLEAGTKVVVTGVEGTHLIVVPVGDGSGASAKEN